MNIPKVNTTGFKSVDTDRWVKSIIFGNISKKNWVAWQKRKRLGIKQILTLEGFIRKRKSEMNQNNYNVDCGDIQDFKEEYQEYRKSLLQQYDSNS